MFRDPGEQSRNQTDNQALHLFWRAGRARGWAGSHLHVDMMARKIWATAFVSASICCLIFSGATCEYPSGIELRCPFNGLQVTHSATIRAALTPFTSPEAFGFTSVRKADAFLCR